VTGAGDRPPSPGRRRPAGGHGGRALTQPRPRQRATPRLETRARARALQALYAWDVRRAATASSGSRSQLAMGPDGSDPDDARLPRVAAEVWDDLAVEPAERQLAAQLVDTVAARRPALDRELSQVATNWRLERMGVVERCVLRLAAAELTREATPTRVVIQEAVRLAERYGSSNSAQFVNGVLDAVARRMGRL
jgi:N utilization substance protein B